MRWKDGHEYDAMDDELFVDPSYFNDYYNPPPDEEIAAARQKKSVTEGKQKMRPNADDLQVIRQIRHDVRCHEGDGGQCGFLAEILQQSR